MPAHETNSTRTPTHEGRDGTLKPSLRSYDGQEDIYGWMYHAEMVARLNGWSQGTLAMMTQVTLVGDAARWWGVEVRARDMETDISWEVLKGLMIEQYAGASVEELVDQAYETTQGNRKVKEYVAELKAIFVRVRDLTEREKLRIFLRNLRPELSRWVRSIGASTLAEAIEVASRAERGTLEPGSTLESRIARMEKELQLLRCGRGETSNRPSEARSGSGHCYTCGEIGHQARQCPKESRRLQGGAGRR